jgi:hypothetical protein
LEEVERLPEDAGLAEMLGHEVPRPEAARKLPYAFHPERRFEQARVELPACRLSDSPGNSGPSRVLAQVNQNLVQFIGRRCVDPKASTVDLREMAIKSFRRKAGPTYE